MFYDNNNNNSINSENDYFDEHNKKFNILIFGGRNKETYLNNLVILDVTYNTTKDSFNYHFRYPNISGDIPEAREGHKSFIKGSTYYLFGGCNHSIKKCFDDVYSIDLKAKKLVWKKIKVKSTNNRNGNSTNKSKYMYSNKIKSNIAMFLDGFISFYDGISLYTPVEESFCLSDVEKRNYSDRSVRNDRNFNKVDNFLSELKQKIEKSELESIMKKKLIRSDDIAASNNKINNSSVTNTIAVTQVKDKVEVSKELIDKGK